MIKIALFNIDSLKKTQIETLIGNELVFFLYFCTAQPNQHSRQHQISYRQGEKLVYDRYLKHVGHSTC